MTLALLTFLHVLVFVYWMGGDLGAFYSSSFMTDPKRPVGERMMALKILNNIDMAPRTALIMALPTGLLVAWSKGWLNISGTLVGAVVIASLLWLALAWTVHLRHGPAGETFRKVDLAIRYAVLVALVFFGIAGLAGQIAIPLFISLKLLILAACVTLGLVVRRQLVPLFGAIRTMTTTGPTPESDAAITQANANARVSVLTIWGLVTAASLLGFATPA